MPKTNAESKARPYSFAFSEEGAACVHLLRSSTAAEFAKYCPGNEQHGQCTGVDGMFLSMFRALHGSISKVGELPEKGSNCNRLCAAFSKENFSGTH